jgi:hypothetical protein
MSTDCTFVVQFVIFIQDVNSEYKTSQMALVQVMKGTATDMGLMAVLDKIMK